MSERVYHDNRTKTFKGCNLNPKDKDYTCHHTFQRSDEHNGLLPQGFHIDNVSNLIPLDIETHKDLHFMLDNIPSLNRIDLRVYMANMAFCGDLCDVPDRLYRVNPDEIMRRNK